MNNDFTIQDGKVIIYVFGGGELHEAIIDLDDFEKADAFDGTWFAMYAKSTDSYYVRGWFKHRGKGVLMHRYLTDTMHDVSPHVDHRNHDTLDNSRSNIHVVTQGENNRNKRTYRTTTSGVRGVYWYKPSGKWKAQGQTPDGKRKSLGYYHNIEDAKFAFENAKKEGVIV